MSDLSQLSTEELLGMLQSHTAAAPPQPQQMNPLQARMGIRGMRSGQGTDTLLPNIGSAIGSAGYDVGGAVTDVTGSPALGTVANVATEAVPMAIGGGLGAAAKLPEAAQGAGRWLMTKALRAPMEARETGQAARAVDTMLEKGLNVTRGSVEETAGRIGQLGDELKSVLANAPETIKGTDVGKRLMETYERFKSQVNPEADLKAIKAAWEEFKNHPDLAGRLQNIPVELANKLKQGTYKALDAKAYGEQMGAATEAQKALARGLKETVGEAKPSVAPILKEQGDLINAKDLMKRRVELLSGQDPISLGWLAAHPIQALGYISERNAPLKGLLARLLYSQAPAAGAPAGRLAGTMAGYPMGSPEE